MSENAKTEPAPSGGRLKKALKISGGLLVLLLIAAAILLAPVARAGTGYKAKILCSALFHSKRDLARIETEDLGHYDYISHSVDRENQSVTCRLGPFSSTAIYRPRLGTVLVRGLSEDALRAQEAAVTEPSSASAVAARPWSLGEPAPQEQGVDPAKLEEALDYAFKDVDAEDPDYRSRAVVIVRRGAVIAERYAPNVTADTPLIGWSMTKSISNALVGILVRQDKLDIREPAPVPGWTGDDPRAVITTDQLLRMSSGLKFNETYGIQLPMPDVVTMLFNAPSAGGLAADQPLEFPPDSVWKYSSGTTNIIAGIIRRSVGDSPAAAHAFARDELFGPLGMSSARVERDPEGTMVLSSFGYATARDWARFGLLYLNDGVVGGRRILPEGWVAYSTTPTPKASKGRYGAQIWLNYGDAKDPEQRWMPKLTPRIYAFRGFEGQYVIVDPTQEMVVVRLGCDRRRGFKIQDFLLKVQEALPKG